MTSRALRRPRAAVAVVALALPLSTALIGATAGPAHAASGSITAPSGPVTSGNSLAVSASISAGTGATRFALSLDPSSSNAGPGDPSGFATDVSMDCSQRDDPSTPLKNEACQGQTKSFTPSLAGRANGKWTASLDGAVNTSKVFYTNFKPTHVPTDLTAQGSGSSRVDLAWNYGGNEPDLAGFRISDGQGNVFQIDASACDSGSCTYASYYNNPTPGTYSYSYSATALRRSGGCGGCGTYTESSESNTASAQLVTPEPPPSPTPTPSPTDGGTTGGTTGSTSGTTTGSTTGSTSGTTTGSSTGSTAGSTSGGSTGTSTGGSGSSGTTKGSVAKPITVPTLPPLVASRRAFALGFNRFSPSLGIPKLPPLPATTFPVTAPNDGTYQPTLPYGAEPRTTTKVLSSPISSVTQKIDTEQLAPPLAVALLLLMAAAHVRIFLSHSAED